MTQGAMMQGAQEEADPRAIARAAHGYEHVLLVMRHAKAAHGGAVGDRRRPLTGRGTSQSHAVARQLVRCRLVPQRIVCSSAERARQTLEGMLPAFGDGPLAEYRESLYEGGARAMLDQLRQAKPDCRSLMLLSHEPAVSEIVQALVRARLPDARDLLTVGMGTANVAVLAADEALASWPESGAELLGIIRPDD